MPFEIKPEYKEFIKSRALEGHSGRNIKKELDELFSGTTHNDVPTSCTVKRYTCHFRATVRDQSANSNLPKNTIDEKYRTFIENGVNQGKRASQIKNELWNTFGEKSVCRRAIFSWATRFRAVAEAANSESVYKYPTFIQNDREKQEFIKSRVVRGLTGIQIKRDIDREYGPNSHSISTVLRWINHFKAAARGSAYDPNMKAGKMMDEKYRQLIENGVYQSKSFLEIKTELWEKYGEMSVSRQSIYKWFNLFKYAYDGSKFSNDQATSMTTYSEETTSESSSENHDVELTWACD